MSDDIENLTLSCPICGTQHEFSIEVDRSHVLYYMTPDMLNRQPPIKRFRRIFTCPEKNQPFQATIALEESFGTILNSVKVVENDLR